MKSRFNWIFIIISLFFTVSIFAWEKIFFIRPASQSINIKPLKISDDKTNALDKHFAYMSFLKIYIDQSLIVLNFPFRLSENEACLVSHLDLQDDTKFYSNEFVKKYSLSERFFELFDFDFDFGYQGIKMTKTNMPLELNYTAIEETMLSGFEIKETFISYYEIHPNWSIFGHLCFLEKYISEKLEQPLLIRSTSMIDDFYLKTFQQTIKYGMGLRWKKNLKADKKIVIDAFLLQKADNHWLIDQMFLQNHEYKGIRFDSWKLSVSLQF